MSEKLLTVDFGAPDKFGVHLFRVEIPAGRTESVTIVEDYGYRGQEGGIPRDEIRVVLSRPVWSGIADIARRDQVACSAETLSELGTDVDYLDLGAILVKGRAEPVACYQINRVGVLTNPNAAPAPQIRVGVAAVAGFH